MMKLLLVAACIAGAPVAIAQTQPTQPAPAVQAAPAEAPKMVCRDEYETGSRIKKKIKVCRPVTEGDKDATTANLQRQLDKSAALGEGLGGPGNN